MRSARKTGLSLSEIIFGFVLSLLLILFSQTGSFKGLSNFTSMLLSGIQTDIYNSFSNIAGELNFLGNISQIKQERDMLKEQVILLTTEKIQLETRLESVESIAQQLDFDLPYKLEPVRVVRYLEANAGEIEINKGTESGLKEGDVVVKGKYAVGRIIEVGSRTSKVQLITSAKSIVPVITRKNKTAGLLRGEFGVGLKMTDVLNDSKLSLDELVITSGLNSDYPYGLYVGKLIELTSVQSELTKEVKVLSEIEFNHLRELFVITNKDEV